MVAGGDTGPKEEAPFWKAALAFGVFAAGNIGLNYFNSWALHDAEDGVPGHGTGGFNFPFFYTAFHMAASACAALILQCTCARPKDGSLPSFSQFWAYKWQLIPISALTFLNNGFNNASLGAVALFVNQVIKATAPFPTSFFEFCVLGKVYNFAIYGSVACIVGGCVLSNAASFAAGGSSQIGGIIQCIISLLAASLKPVLQKLVMSGGAALKPCGGACMSSREPSTTEAPKEAKPEKPPLSPPQTLFWDTLLAFFIFVVVILVDSDERQAAFQYLAGDTPNPQSGLLGAGIITFGSALAFVFNIATYYYIMYTSALSSTIGSNAVKIFLIVMSAVTGGEAVTLTWVGIGVVVASIGSYAYFAYQFAQQGKKAIVSDEKTPLATKGSSA